MGGGGHHIRVVHGDGVRGGGCGLWQVGRVGGGVRGGEGGSSAGWVLGGVAGARVSTS